MARERDGGINPGSLAGLTELEDISTSFENPLGDLTLHTAQVCSSHLQSTVPENLDFVNTPVCWDCYF